MKFESKGEYVGGNDGWDDSTVEIEGVVVWMDGGLAEDEGSGEEGLDGNVEDEGVVVVRNDGTVEDEGTDVEIISIVGALE